MSYDGNRLLPIEWLGSILWISLWGTLGYVAIAEESITLGGRSIAHYEGTSAVVAGFLLVGAALVGVDWLLRVSPCRRALRAFLVCAWLGLAIVLLIFR